MKKSLLFLTVAWGLLLSGCHHSSGVVWEDAKTVGRRLHRKAQLLWRKDVDSRMIETTEDFKEPAEEDYIPYQDSDITSLKTDFAIPAPKEDPGAIGSSIPGIKDFHIPKGSLSSLFRTLHFDTDTHVIKTKESMTLAKIADYMRHHPKLYIFVEGHCDARGSEDYNLSLGTRRANAVRAKLVKLGVNPNQIYTISFGKELPIDSRQTHEAWAKNRRAEFKLFENK